MPFFSTLVVCYEIGVISLGHDWVGIVPDIDYVFDGVGKVCYVSDFDIVQKYCVVTVSVFATEPY